MNLNYIQLSILFSTSVLHGQHCWTMDYSPGNLVAPGGENVGTYKFLTYEQMKRLGIDNHTSNLSSNLKQLRESKKPVVKKIPHRIGTPVKHYLSHFGKRLLVDHLD